MEENFFDRVEYIKECLTTLERDYNLGHVNFGDGKSSYITSPGIKGLHFIWDNQLKDFAVILGIPQKESNE